MMDQFSFNSFMKPFKKEMLEHMAYSNILSDLDDLMDDTSNKPPS